MSWIHGPLLGFDTETTGVDVDHDRIVSAALVHRDATGTRIRTWLLAPGVPIPDVATAVHGIATEQAERHGRPPAEALEEIAVELADAVRRGVPVVAYNASFDLALLEAELRRHGLRTLAERLGGDVAPVLDPFVLDRCEDADRAGGRRLVDVCGVYGVVGTGRMHRADVDVLATLDLLTALVDRFPRLGTVDPGTLHDRQVAAHRAWTAEHTERRAGVGGSPPGSGSGSSRPAATAAAARPAPSLAGVP